MDTKIITKEEKNKIEIITNKILEPIDGRTHISNDYYIMHCSVTIGESDRKEWEEYWYHIEIKTNLGNYFLGKAFSDFKNYEDIDLSIIAWNIAYEVFRQLDGNYNGLLAKNLWPQDNQRMPDYNRFI